MTIFRIAGDKIAPIETTTFQEAEVRERRDIQRMLKTDISVISGDSPDNEILVVAEEFSHWEDSDLRIDLLGIDKKTNLVVIELKRTESGGHMDLQAIRYAAMISELTFDNLVTAHSKYLAKSESDKDAKNELLKFLEKEPSEDRFGQEVKIILVSAGFDKELTTSVLWLNDSGLDIRCVRIQPYAHNKEILLDVQTIIPLPETAEYQVKKKKKEQEERKSRSGGKDYTKYNVSVAGGELHEQQSKNRAMLHLVSGVLKNGGTPEHIEKITKKTLFKKFEGELDAQQIQEINFPGHKLYFMREGEIFPSEGKTYLLTSNWQGSEPEDAADAIKNAFSDLEIKFERAD